MLFALDGCGVVGEDLGHGEECAGDRVAELL